MKNFIQETIKEQLKNGPTTAISFRTDFEDIGHVQFSRGEWAIFFNARCVMVAKTLTTIVKKLQKLNVNEFDFEQEF